MARSRHRRLDPLTAGVVGLFDHLDGVQFWIKDRDGRYEWVNRGFLMNYALERVEQVIGRTDHDLSPAHLADQYRLDDERVLAGEPVENRLELVGRFDRTATWSQTTKLPVRDARGRIVGTLGITRVVDEQVIASDSQDAALGRVVAHMRAQFQRPLSNPELARVAGRSVRALERLFQRQTHMAPQQYLRRLRVRLACRAIVAGRRALTEVAVAHGFYDQSHFVREFRRETGLTPTAYRAKYAAGQDHADV
jgi:AraC-like DNA-binding protein